jgi:hypothetical protein
VLLAACSRDEAKPAEGTKASVPPPVASPAAAPKPFGAFCVEDGECAGAVCFHKRLKTTQSGPETRDGGDPVEHDGYCSMRCNGDADCPSPPSNGRCGARGMCKRPE